LTRRGAFKQENSRFQSHPHHQSSARRRSPQPPSERVRAT
jgi:histone H2A